ncbi:hypothetical protein HYN59_06875 [Flavobacterium album]|uniref:Knr4/Smi1-like domain-containing protein n=1 Tax=Flavobacterium album TaxID=2175091 RepID=A0A2S1QWT4_9FLAO|nr:SMI1/KNR4 family protein [Flavobacterium album]AWH84862.1 hypothetical protein HYN59_06875 [Flavobacterium album]
MDISYERSFEKLGGIPDAKIDVDSFKDYLKRHSIDLPKDIFDLLADHSGEYFKNDIEITNVELVPTASSGKIGLGSIVNANDIKDIIQIIGYLPDDVFPVMEGSAGDHIVVGIGRSNYGKMYYWYHEANYGEEMTLIFNSFKDFVDNLQQVEDDNDDPREVVGFWLDL